MIGRRNKLSTKLQALVNNFRAKALIRPREWNTECGLCNTRLITSRANNYLCRSCLADLPYNNNCCQCCAVPMSQTVSICPECMSHPPSFDDSLSVFIYDFPVDRLIQQFKYDGHRYLCKPLCSLIIDEFSAQTRDVEAIIPIPLHKKRLKERGFNQATLLAMELSEQLDINLRTDILLKPNPNKQQATLSKKQRIHNLNECFQINPKIRDLPRRVVLFDDVVTTGATIEAAASLLKKKGVEYVAVWSLARTAKPKNK